MFADLAKCALFENIIKQRLSSSVYCFEFALFLVATMASTFPLEGQNILVEDYDENYEPTEEGKVERFVAYRLHDCSSTLPWTLEALYAMTVVFSTLYNIIFIVFITRLYLEVLEYCKVLELDPIAEKEMLYIAREGIKAPLPTDWKPM